MPGTRLIRYGIFAALLFLIALSCSCGGGGSAGSAQSGTLFDPAASYQGVNAAAVPTSANAENLILGAYAAGRLGTKVSTIGRAGKSTARETAAALPMRELVQALKLSTRRLGVPKKAQELRENRSAARPGKTVARSTSSQVTGDRGGSATYQLEVNDSTGSFYGTVNFQGFTSGNAVINGVCDMLGSLDLNRQELSQLTLSFKTLSMTGSSDNYLLAGTLAWTYSFASSSDTLSMNMVLKDLSVSKTYWFRNYLIATSYGAGSLSQTASGRYYDPDQGFVDLSTPNQMVASYGAKWPSRGLLVTSASGRWIQLQFQTSTYSVAADTNGDGAGDWQVEHPSDSTPAVNSPPVAQAGADQTVTLAAAVQLDGSQSSDPDGDILSYSWSFVSLPAGGTAPALAGSNTATPSFSPAALGTYQLQLSVFDGSATSSDTVSVEVISAPPLAPGALKQTWQFGIFGSNIGKAGLLTADLDGDGVPEIIASASNGGFGDNVFWYVVRKNASGAYEQVWRSENYGVTIVRLLLADLNGDGKNDVVVALSDGTIRCYDGPTLKELPRLTVAPALRDLAVADLAHDGHLELVTTDGSAVRVYSAETGALKWTKNGCGGTSLAVGNVDDDAQLEIVTTGYGAKGYVIDGISGSVKWEYPDGFGALVRLADLDGDGRQEIVGASSWYKITIFDAEIKSPAWEIVTQLDIGALLIADTDGDGIPEIVYGDSQWGKIHAVDAKSHREKWSVNNPEHGVQGIGFADVDLDGKKELLWGAGGSSTGADFLYVADPSTGTIKWQNLDFSGLSALALGDLNNDGTSQLLMVTDYSNSGYDEGIIHVFDAQSHALSFQKPLGISDWMGSSRTVRIGDLDGDGKSEFVVSTANLYDGLIKVYDGATRTAKRQSAGYDGNFFSALALGDVDGDGKVEIVAGTGYATTGATGNYLIVFDGVTLQEKWRSVSLGSNLRSVYDLKLADLDRDGHQDIVLTVDGSRLIVYDGVSHVLKLMIDTPARALEVVDLNGDGFPEILVGRTDGKIDVYDGVSFALKKTVTTSGTSPVDALKVVDLDGNGSLKWLVASGGVLSVLQGDKLYWRSGNLGANLGRGNSIAVQDTDHDGHPNIFIGTDSVLYQFKYQGTGS
jgi:hypothetical protein